nr:hypothetical protein [Tanacetum cinerariifolium]
MVDPEVNEEVVDDDDWDDEVGWLMAPVMPPRDTMTVLSTYEVGVPRLKMRNGEDFSYIRCVIPLVHQLVVVKKTSLPKTECSGRVVERKDWKLQPNGDICLHHGGRRTK